METPAKELSSLDFESMIGGPLRAVVNAQAQAAMSSVNFIKAVGFKPPGPDGASTGEPIYVSFKYPKEVAPYQPAQPASFTLRVTNGGSGYTSPPTLEISGGGGSGATATATIQNGAVTSVQLTAPGTGYTSAPTIAVTTGGGSGATVEAVFQAATPFQPAQFQEMKLDVPILTMLPIPFIRIEETTIDFNAKINSVEETKTDSSFKLDVGLDASAKFAMVSAKLKVNTSYQKNTSSGSKVDRTYSMAVHVRAVQDEMPEGLSKLLGILEDAIKSQPVAG